ncbi:MAG: thioredoxin fold domain-containing protein [Bacteroidia bacterium]
MKKWFTLLFIAVVLIQSFAFKADQKIRFRKYNWTDIGRSAKAHNKMIFVLITGEYCTSSKKMKRVMTDKRVAEFFNKKFVSTNFDAENFFQFYRSSNWGISAVPAMVFLDKDRNVVHKVEGYLNVQSVLKEAQTALEKQKK